MNNNVLTAEEVQQKIKKSRRHKTAEMISSHAVLIIVSLFIILPIYVALVTSIMSSAEANLSEFHWWPQNGITFKAYERMFKKNIAGNDLLQGTWNTMWIYVPSTIVCVLVSACAAYAFAKIDFKLNKPIFAVLISSLTLPNCVGLIASFLIFDRIGWVNTALPLIVPRCLGGIGAIFFLRQFYMGLPDVLLDAARLDGLNEFQIFYKIGLPLSLPALGSQFILLFIAGYNDYMGPLLYIHDARYYTIQISLAFYRDAYVQDWPLLMAGAFITMLPLIILYMLSQKFILKGISITSGLKG